MMRRIKYFFYFGFYNEKRTTDRLVPIDMKIKRKLEIPKEEVYDEEENISEEINFEEWVGKNKIDFVLMLLICDDSRKIIYEFLFVSVL